MLITKSGNIIFEPVEFSQDLIYKAKLIISNFKDEVGILYKITGVLFINGYNIISAKIETKDQKIEDIFTIEPQNHQMIINSTILEKIEADLYRLLKNEISMSEYLASYPEKTRLLLESSKPYPETEIEVNLYDSNKCLKIHLKTKDRPGLLYFISQILFLMDFNILEFNAKSENQLANDTFIVEKKNQREVNERNINDLVKILKKFI